MALTPPQEKKYWREWAQACRAQSWRGASADTQRKAWHARLGLPPSHKDWHNGHFNSWISGTAHLRNAVDIRDRERENASWTIERLRAAFITLLGNDYARSIMLDWRDTEDLENFPVSDSAKLLDLKNLRNTLKRRLGRIITRIKSGELHPGPDCPNIWSHTEAEIIAAITSGQPQSLGAPPPPKRKYVLDPTRKYAPAASDGDPF